MFIHFGKFAVRLIDFLVKVVKFLGSLGGVLVLSSPCCILTEIILANKAGHENDLSIAPVAAMDSTNSPILRFGCHFVLVS
jgi:hypothetical protein